MHGHGGRIIGHGRSNSYVKKKNCARVRVFFFLHCCERGRLESVPAGGGMMATMLPYVHIIMHMHMLLRYVRDAGRMRASSCACRTSLLLELRSVPYVCGSGCMLLLNARVSAIRVGRYPVEGESSNGLLRVGRLHGFSN
jgi:hypothetical protein